ncbi:hypothetical protein [Ruficoccus sp. ZRK36]|uniref:L-fucose/L-arabinose isomerase family protein n=1 Tax=Ruficoccus sp. ZRK36 TaxID=2866311 RepID=UPI001C734688|nr:hypothetical protein [Ruficoccus sp. ZRK36]QYY34330.1 hypothetical protein K0V07_08360 [Ruficoccus sp. ZRK36]
MSDSNLTIGYVPCAKGSWVDKHLEAIRAQGREALIQSSPGARTVGGETIITTEAEAQALIEKLETERVDVLVVHFITFALGAVVPMLVERLKVPVLLWSMPEPPMQGGRISSNSFCAVNMNAHAMWVLGYEYLHVHAPLEDAAGALGKKLNVFKCLKSLSRFKLGVVGNRVPGFYASNADELLLRRELGVEIELITLWELIESTRKISEQKQAEGLKVLTGSGTPSEGVNESELSKGAALYEAFLELKDKYHLTSFAVRCWPEFGDMLGIAVCAISSLLNDEGILTGCEGDIYGTVTMMMEHELTGELPFFCDLISIDSDENVGMTWHCGAAPASLCCSSAKPELRKHSIMDGGGKKGLTMEFPIKTGKVTMARLSENQNGDGYRMLITTGTAIPTEQVLRGNPMKIKFDADLSKISETLVYGGFEHHFSVIHGDIVEELKDLCRLRKIEPVVID